MISPIVAIIKKDLKSFLTSSMFYTLSGLCCLLWGIFFSFKLYTFVTDSFTLSTKIQDGGLNIHQHLIADYIVIVHYVLVFIIAAMSLRFFAEEKKMQTFSVLLTSPMTSWQIVLAKWLAGASVIFILLAISAVLPLSLLFFTSLPLKLLFLSYFGLFIILCSYMSASLVASSLTDSMIICVVLSLVFNILLLLMGVGREFTDNLMLKEFFNFIAINGHFSYFRSGLLNFSSVFYFLSLSAFFGLITERVIEFHRWR